MQHLPRRIALALVPALLLGAAASYDKRFAKPA